MLSDRVFLPRTLTTIPSDSVLMPPDKTMGAILQRILVPLDGSPSVEQALALAETLVQAFNGELILLQVVQPPAVIALYGVPGYEIALTSKQEQAQSYLSSLQNTYRRRNIPIRALSLTSPAAAKTIVDVAAQKEVDIIIKAMDDRSGLSRLIYGDVARKVSRQAPCPVLLVR